MAAKTIKVEQTASAIRRHHSQRATLVGLKLIEPVTNTGLQDAAVNEGLLTVAAGMNVLRLAPPLIITEADADEAVALLDRACLAITPQRAAAQ